MFLTPETSEFEQAEHKTDHINKGIPHPFFQCLHVPSAPFHTHLPVH